MELQGLIWMAKALPEKNWVEDLDFILLMAAVAVYLVYCAISLTISYRRNRYCTCCHSKTRLGTRTERRSASTRFRRFFGRTSGVAAVVVLRCPKCGWEIDLGK